MCVCDVQEAKHKTMDQSDSYTSTQSRSEDRKTVEKNRRIQMKSLYSELNSLLPQTTREPLTLPDQLDEAANYIKKLQVNVEKKRERKRNLLATTLFEKSNFAESSLVYSSVGPKRMPKIEIQETGSILHIFLVTSLEHKFLFHEIIRLLNKELEAEITHAGYSTVDDVVLHTFHCKVEKCDYGARSGIYERLEKFVNNVN